MNTQTRTGTSTLVIDWTACDGRGVCTELLPELLAADPDGYPMARSGGSRGGVLTAVPPQLAEPARRAVKLCPLLALRLEKPAQPPR